jgi:hypothetical protein
VKTIKPKQVLILLGVVFIAYWLAAYYKRTDSVALSTANIGASARPDSGNTETATSNLPVVLDRPALERPSRNPFAQLQPAISLSSAPTRAVTDKKPTPVVQTPVTPVIPEPAAPPLAPPLDLRFAGRMMTPDGRTLVLAQVGETAYFLNPGLVLPNGYQVTGITEQAVQLLYPPLKVTAQLDLPVPPANEIR